MKNYLKTTIEKKVKFAIFIFLSISIVYSCHKNDLLGSMNYKYDESFFKRNDSLSSVFTNINGTDADNNLLNKLISDFKKYDQEKQIVENIKTKFGKPFWDISIVLKNTNKLKTIVTPVVNAQNSVTALIFFYQNDSTRTTFKIVNRQANQSKLRLYGNKEATLFTRTSLTGLFGTADKYANSILASKTMNSTFTIISWICWNYTWAYTQADGTVVVGATIPQCSYTISFDYMSLASIDDGGGGGGGGGNIGGSASTPPNDPCQNSQQIALDIAQTEFNDYTGDKSDGASEKVNLPDVGTYYTEIFPWKVVEHINGIWYVQARTKITLSWDNLSLRNDKALTLEHLEAKYVGSNSIVISDWIPGPHSEIITNNHTPHPSGKAFVSGTIHHKMKAGMKIDIPNCGSISIDPGFETYNDRSGSLLVSTQ